MCRRAREHIIERGKGRGKQGKSIEALLRNRLFCPKCGAPMVVRQGGHTRRAYYYCSRYCRPWADNPCTYNKFIPGMWDDLVWGDICTWLRDDDWVDQQLTSEQSQDENTAKLIRLQEWNTSFQAPLKRFLGQKALPSRFWKSFLFPSSANLLDAAFKPETQSELASLQYTQLAHTLKGMMTYISTPLPGLFTYTPTLT